MKILSTIFLLFISINLAQAIDTAPITNLKEYDVEIIIFEDAHARYLNSETWQQTAPDSDSSDSSVITKKSINPKFKSNNLTLIKPSILTAKYKRINTSSEFNVLFYGAWRQTGLDKNKTFDINIDELKNNHASKSKNTLSGTFKLVLARYLHMYSNLEYKRISIAETSDESPDITTNNTDTYQLKSHRRMRSKELHYIDHPLVGILLQINPVKKNEEAKSL